MEIPRWVLVTRRREEMPFRMDGQYREREGRRQYFIKPDSNDDWASWWAPDMFSVHPFQPVEEGAEGGEIGEQRLYRFPAREDESGYFEEEQEKQTPLSSDVEMTEAEQ